MITRIVKLTIQPNKKEAFIQMFKESKPHITAFEGCNDVVLLQDKKFDNVFFTYSHWRSKEDLEAYRKSDLFKGIWKNTKAKFCAEPQAWSTEEIA